MKLRTLVKVAVTTSVVLLCTGFAMYSFFKLSAASERNYFNLYELVPTSASLVLETDNFYALVKDINELTCSKKKQFLHVSKLFSYLKDHLNTVVDDSPHGLSRQMNKVLLSFHEPDDEYNQILYCQLGEGDYEWVGKYVQRYLSSSYPPKTCCYNGEEFIIFPMADGDFIACYLTHDFMVMSYRKRLVEEAIDAYHLKRSLATDSVFNSVYTPKKNPVVATVYTRMHSLNMGMQTDTMLLKASLGSWTEFDMRLNGDYIYFSGISHDRDTTLTLMNVFRRQQSVKGIPGDILPSTTIFFTNRSISDLSSMLTFTETQEYSKWTNSDQIRSCDEALASYLIDNGKHDLMTCLFLRQDSLLSPAAVASLLMNDCSEAENLLNNFIKNENDKYDLRKSRGITFLYTFTRAYPVYTLPPNTLFMQLTGVWDPLLNVFGVFYNNRLLLSCDKGSLSEYVRYLERKDVLKDIDSYKSETKGLAEAYSFMLMADFNLIFKQSENFARMIPSFFFKNSDFFQHFILSAQFACTDKTVYPNLVFMYKDENSLNSNLK